MKSADSNTISMGKPVTAPVLVPVLHSSTPNCIAESFMVDGKPYKVTCISFGTPHGVVFTPDVDGMDISVPGTLLETHALFPKGASIVFVQQLDGDCLKARLWQRYEGEKAFSSEAACAAAVSAMMLQKIRQREADVYMGEHSCHVTWNGDTGEVYLTA